MIRYFGIAIVVFALACSGETTNTTNENANQQKDTIFVQDTTQSVEADTTYAQQWENFKKAVIDKNAEAVNEFMNTDVIDAESLIETLHADWIMEAFSRSTYNDLTDSEYNEIPAKEFGVYEEYVDEDGNAFESATMFYFEIKDGKIKLIGMLAAG